MSQNAGCASPEATTSAILGASTSGWSPIRTAKRPNLADAILSSSPQRDSLSSTYAGSEAGGSSPQQIPTHRANIAVLRSHGLVSNSIFKSGNASPTHSSNVSPMASPTRQSPFVDRHQQRGESGATGLGLGIKAQSTSPIRMGAPRSASNSSINSNQSTSDAENEEVPVQRSPFRSNSPRKSKGISKLEKASYVSNSPFRKQAIATTEVHERPLELPNNAWAASAAIARPSPESPTRQNPERINGVPRTPERTPQRTGTAMNNGETQFGTPSSQLGTPRGGTRNASSINSPSGRGLLVSNRLHGPRLMDLNSGTSTPQESPLRKERRKTVTFDEVLDVQEFDRESSFDGHSLQSASSQASSLNFESEADDVGSPDEEMWLRNGASKVVEKLMVVNGSPDTISSTFSTPDLESSQQGIRNNNSRNAQQMQSSDMMESSSTDSRELSSIDEPRSPPPEEMSLEYEHADKTFNTAPDVSYFNESLYADQDSDLSGGNLSAYGALHRVDSLVDELLEGDLLGKKTQITKARNISDSPPRRRRAGSQKLNEQEKVKPLPSVPVQTSQVQLSLPLWSPLMSTGDYTAPSNKDTVEEEAQGQVSVEDKVKVAKPRPAVRPHISRDAILQRVAREKMMQQEDESKDKKIVKETKEEGVPAAKSQNAIATRKSEGSALVTRSASGTIIGPKAPSTSKATEEKKVYVPLPPSTTIALPTATIQVPAADLESPLERLGVTVAAEHNQMASTLERLPSLAGSESTKRQERWFDERSIDDSFFGPMSPSVLGGDMPKLTPAQQAEMIIARRRSKNGKSTYRPKSRRSLSEGDQGTTQEGKLETIESMEKVAPVFHDEGNDAELMEEEIVRNRHLLDASLKGAIDNGFETGLEREISRIYHQGEQKYNVNDRGVFTSGLKAEEKVAHSVQAGDVDSGKAWRRVRRPSDMNEYAKEMREYRENENPKKAAGKVFVLIDSFVPSSLPVPNKPTRFYCILDNGLHVVKTATAALKPGSAAASKIGQEFELIQHKNLEFSLTLVVQRDPHLQEPRPESPSSVRKMTPSFSRGMGKLFSSPKKKAAFAASGTSSSMASTMTLVGANGGVEPMLSYINKEGAFGRADVVFEKVAQQCLATCLTLDLPVRGVYDPAPSLSSALQKTTSIDFSRNVGKIRGTLRLKLFYLPPMPSVPRNLMPQNMGDCIKGMEAAKWHSSDAWMEGTLTQLGGDCVSWRRRPVKAQGAHLIGYNEITKKPTIKIDLRKAVSVERTHDPVNNGKQSNDDEEELDETYHVERSFRVTFKDGEKISFFADTDEEMQKWMTALKKVVENKEIPNGCIWATMAMDMIKASKEKREAAQAVVSNNNIKRLPLKANESPAQSPQAAMRSSSSQGRLGASASSSSLSSQLTTPHRIPRVPVPSALSAVPEGKTITSEQTPVRRRPMSVALPPQQQPIRQSSLNHMGLERPQSVYVDGRL